MINVRTNNILVNGYEVTEVYVNEVLESVEIQINDRKMIKVTMTVEGDKILCKRIWIVGKDGRCRRYSNERYYKRSNEIIDDVMTSYIKPIEEIEIHEIVVDNEVISYTINKDDKENPYCWDGYSFSEINELKSYISTRNISNHFLSRYNKLYEVTSGFYKKDVNTIKESNDLMIYINNNFYVINSQMNANYMYEKLHNYCYN